MRSIRPRSYDDPRKRRRSVGPRLGWARSCCQRWHEEQLAQIDHAACTGRYARPGQSYPPARQTWAEERKKALSGANAFRPRTLIFEARAFSPALIFCEFVKCTLLIDHSTATSVYRMRVRRLQYRQARTGRTARVVREGQFLRSPARGMTCRIRE
jgi:hypothetical protein